MTTLAQYIAIHKSVKSAAQTALTNAYHIVQKPTLFTGLVRTYTPKQEDGVQQPPEITHVQMKVEQLITEVVKELTKLFDNTATIEYANTHASADIVVNGHVLLAKVPITYLLFLEKQLTDIRTFISKMPVLDSTEVWSLDELNALWLSEAKFSISTEKVMKHYTMAPATDKHPAQVQAYSDNVSVGTWRKVVQSGAIPQARVTELLARVETLQHAVKFAREQANAAVVESVHPGERLLAFIFH